MFGNVSGRTWEQYWKNIQIGFKYLAVITLAIALINIFTNLLALLLLNNIVWTVNRFHLWRIFTSFLVDTNAINVIFNIYIISTCLPSVVSLTIFIGTEIFNCIRHHPNICTDLPLQYCVYCGYRDSIIGWFGISRKDDGIWTVTINVYLPMAGYSIQP